MNSPDKFVPVGGNPFTPGMGKTPPLTAGRDRELAELNGYLERLRSPGRGEFVAIYAPRGNGKTVLLNWLEETALAAGMCVARTTPGDDGSLATADLQQLLLPGVLPDASRLSLGAGVNLGAAAFNVQWSLEGGGKPGLFKEHLKDACKSGPRALLIDEAHQWTGNDRRKTLGIVQEVMDQHALLVVAAGTPGLMETLRPGVTFVERAPKLCPQLLDAEAAVNAIKVPLGQGGIGIDDGAIRSLIGAAQCYPYFLQLWGEALWNHAAQHGRAQLGEQDAQAVAAGVGKARDGFYRVRFDELRKDPSLRLAATVVADAFAVAGEFDQDAMAEAISLALVEEIPGDVERWQRAESLLTELIKLGYLWTPASSLLLQPGIPSLMAFVAQRRTDRQPQLPPAEIRRLSNAAKERQSPRAWTTDLTCGQDPAKVGRALNG